MTPKKVTFKSGTGPTILEKIKKCLTPEEYEFVTQQGNFDKLLKARYSFEVPKRRHQDKYEARCMVHEVASKLDREDSTMSITAMAKHPKVIAVLKEYDIVLDERAKQGWISEVVHRSRGRKKK